MSSEGRCRAGVVRIVPSPAVTARTCLKAAINSRCGEDRAKSCCHTLGHVSRQQSMCVVYRTQADPIRQDLLCEGMSSEGRCRAGVVRIVPSPAVTRSDMSQGSYQCV
ncbi:hypothetical protein J6590_054547 [Homalodisca vitripennis]|nr:hypothetical protein J6590_054547 [Homalodisca vitripennis]